MRHLDPGHLEWLWMNTLYLKSGAGFGIPIPGAPILRRASGPVNNAPVSCMRISVSITITNNTCMEKPTLCIPRPLTKPPYHL